MLIMLFVVLLYYRNVLIRAYREVIIINSNNKKISLRHCLVGTPRYTTVTMSCDRTRNSILYDNYFADYVFTINITYMLLKFIVRFIAKSQNYILRTDIK